MKVLIKHASLLALSILVISPGCKSDNKTCVTDTNTELECIAQIIAQDERLGAIRNHASIQLSLSLAIDQYTAALKELDYTQCPEGFSIALTRHVQAWEDMKSVTDQFPELRGEMHALFDSIAESDRKTKFDVKLKMIWDTWAEVESEINNIKQQ